MQARVPIHPLIQQMSAGSLITPNAPLGSVDTVVYIAPGIKLKTWIKDMS